MVLEPSNHDVIEMKLEGKSFTKFASVIPKSTTTSYTKSVKLKTNPRSIMKKLLIVILYLFNANIGYCQDFGEVSEAELNLNSCVEQPDADVIIIFDKCSMRITHDFDLQINYHKRIKVLTEEGKEYANVKIRYWNKDIINSIDAICISPDGEEYELDSDNIFEEEGEKSNTISFAIPGVEVGSIIEYEYRHWSDYVTRLEPWYFQDKNYTMLSELKVLMPNGYQYHTLLMNTLNYNFVQDEIDIPDIDRSGKKIKQFTWTAKNITGIKEEPFINNIYDKYAKILFILHSYKDLYNSFIFSKTWDEIAENISKTYNKYIHQDDLTEDKAIELTASTNSKLEKAKIIYEYLREEIKTTSHKTLYGDDFKDPEEVLESKEGSSSEKNMLLINMLNLCGLDAKPLLISTRSNGTVVPNYHEPWQFNRLICLLKIDDQKYFLHSGIKSNPFGYLTPATDVDVGLLINDDEGNIMNLSPPKPPNNSIYKTECEIVDDNVITANTIITYSGYCALEERDIIGTKNKEEIEEYVKDMLEKLYAGSELDSFSYTGIDSYDKELLLNISYKLIDYMDETDDLVYFAFPLFSASKTNPFKSERRYFDVDYKYTAKTSEEIRLILPKNLSVIETPVKKRFGIKDYTFGKYYLNNDSSIICSRIETIKSKSVRPKDYPSLKKMTENIISSDQEQLVLKKNDAEIQSVKGTGE